MNFKEMTKEQLIIELEKLKEKNKKLNSLLVENKTVRGQLEKMIEEARSGNQSYLGLFNSVSDAVYIHKADGIFIDVNEGAVKMYGYSREELIGMNPENVCAPGKNNMEMVMGLMQKVLLTGEPQQFEFWAKRRNGEIFLKDIIYNKGKYHGEDIIITTARDITERKLNEEKFIQQNEYLEKMNAEKDKFFSIIAHDLRSPFSGFLGLTEMMADKLMSMSVNEIQKHATLMKGSAINLYRLLENLLEWTRMQKGVTVYKPEVFSLSKVVNECIKTSVDQATTKNISCEINVPEKLFVYADIHMVETICRNLTSNAVKYTPRGGSIIISTQLNEDNFVSISIHDNGIGMNQEIVENLFKIDRTFKRIGTEGEPSSGLGLLLCKDFVEKNRGRIWVESKENEGTTFFFTLPLFFSKKIDITE